MNLECSRQRRARACLTLALALWLGSALALGGPSQPALGQPLQKIAVSITDIYGGELVGVTLRGGQQETVRLAGISITRCVEGSAAARTRALTGGRWGYLELSSQQRDTYGYLVGYIWIDTVVLNVDLVRNGVAVPIGGPSRYQQDLTSARNAARAGAAGGWGSGCFV